MDEKKIEVWFGSMEFGDFVKYSNKRDEFPCCLIHRIDMKKELWLEDIEVYQDTYGYDSYVCPKVFKGEIYYSPSFIEELV